MLEGRRASAEGIACSTALRAPTVHEVLVLEESAFSRARRVDSAPQHIHDASLDGCLVAFAEVAKHHAPIAVDQIPEHGPVEDGVSYDQ